MALKRQAMEDELEQAFTSQAADIDRYNYLAKLLQDGGGYDGFFHSFREVFKVFEDWKLSNHVVWPFPGGRLDQPRSWIHDLDSMGYREEFYRIRKRTLTKDALPFDEARL